MQDEIVWEKQLVKTSNENVHFWSESGVNAKMEWR